MITSLTFEGNHGRINHCIYSPGIRGHIRQAHHDFGSGYVVRSGVLYDVGGRLDKSSDSCYIRSIQLPSGTNQGEKSCQVTTEAIR
jgi:hypothetical protein